MVNLDNSAEGEKIRFLWDFVFFLRRALVRLALKSFFVFFPPACIFNSLTNERKVGATGREKTDSRSRRMLTTASV